MQNMLFLRDKVDGPTTRIINLDLLAWVAPLEGGGTEIFVGGGRVTLGMEFSEFIKHVEHLIAENYRISNETSAKWHVKRMEDTKQVMIDAMKSVHDS